MACSTVLTAGAAAGAVVLSPGPVAAQQTDAIGSASAATAGAAATQSTSTPQATLGQSLADFEARHAAARAAAALRASRADAAAHARSARARAARLAAPHQAASGGQSATPVAAAEPSGSPQHIAMAMLGSFGWSSSQFGCLDQLWSAESGWNPEAANASGAYGIPQALPGAKMASAGPDWQTDAATQIKWGLGYIKGSYGSPCGAWAHEETAGWY